MKKQHRILFNSASVSAQKNKKKILQKIGSVIDSGIFLNGKENKLLQKNLLNYLGNNGAIILTASGHDALSIALASLNLQKDDEVIFPVNSYPTAFPVFMTKCTPRPVDVDQNGQVTAEILKKNITPKTKVVIQVHLYGLVSQMDPIIKLTKSKNITLIEDCAQSLGSKYKGKMTGTLGDIGCFSFYPTKNISTLGDGGCLYTRDKKQSAFFQKAVSYGEEKRYFSQFLAGHSRLPEIQAGIVNALFKKGTADLEKRIKLAQYFREKIKDALLDKYIRLLESSKESQPVTHLFVAAFTKRDALRRFLNKKGIPTAVHYPKPINLVKAFSFGKFQKGDFPQAEKLSREILSLPFNPYMTKEEIDYVVENIKNFYV